MVLKFERFFYLSSLSFGLDSPIGLGYHLSLVLSLRVVHSEKGLPRKEVPGVGFSRSET